MSKGTILVVDDDAPILDLVRMTLEDDGYAVLVSADGAALRLAHEQQPDLILLDLTLFWPDGFATMERLRADPATAHIPLIAFSARSDIEEVATRMRLDAVLPKPFDLDALTCLVERWVVQGRQRRLIASVG